MAKNIILQSIFWAGLLLMPEVVAGGPKAVFKTVEMNVGTVDEKKSKVVKRSFEIKNVGDSELQLFRIKLDCSCTSFECDSFIAPGKSGIITMNIDLSKIQGGKFYKSLTLSTNDPIYGKVKLTLFGILKSIIYTDSGAIVLPTVDKKDTTKTVSIYSEKPDLQVREVLFEMDNPLVSWQAKLPIKFKFNKLGTMNKENFWVYSLQIYYYPVTNEYRYGKFIAVTNHPDKPEFKINGVLCPRN